MTLSSGRGANSSGDYQRRDVMGLHRSERDGSQDGCFLHSAPGQWGIPACQLGRCPRPKVRRYASGSNGRRRTRKSPAVPGKICDRIPPGLRRTLTWDQGSEMAGHRELTEGWGIEVCFAEPHSPWRRPTNNNGSGLLRRWLPRTPTSPFTYPTPSASSTTHQHHPSPLSQLGHRARPLPCRSRDNRPNSPPMESIDDNAPKVKSQPCCRWRSASTQTRQPTATATSMKRSFHRAAETSFGSSSSASAASTSRKIHRAAARHYACGRGSSPEPRLGV